MRLLLNVFAFDLIKVQSSMSPSCVSRQELNVDVDIDKAVFLFAVRIMRNRS